MQNPYTLSYCFKDLRYPKKLSFFLIAAALSLLLAGCSGSKPEAPARPPAPVTVATVVQKTMPMVLKAIGNVEAYSTVQVKSQVEGQVVRVHFQEGQEVKKGELMFTIDPRPFEAQLQQALANLARDQALLENARRDARRYEALIRQNLVSTGEYEQYATKAASLEATVKADAAAVENARLKLEYTAISSPIDGKTGDILINQGNLVKANDEKAILVVINQIVPIYVNFTLPEQHLPEVKKYMNRRRLRVEVAIPPAEQYCSFGELVFVDNKVDQATGTVQLKALFQNQDRTLWPGQFVNVSLILTEQPNALVIPAQALQVGQQGNYVYVIIADRTAEARPVELDRTADGSAVIKSGLKSGEEVVIDGQLRLYPGAKVEIQNPSPPAIGPERPS
ncbi:efflux RND transporter periplasmic adaptor subunit [Desulfobacca acetoxidans]|uniref:Efflux transporter, RND family, MFP subunit n=1 Tax=Desulfobacca acetoxidans (strain ATCC 700848 / DSM 11109 / ASRB2) TaxID=880072 RepID=F2NJ87_DESAR|nr:efflux RND transporter periplasmic adaptor subunit [Desulfobacca acetoxidans]AEB09259.1 efflux transporter, RND family, MFP subunit [Desulfobacca acetoxidans DSM 11109]